MKKKLVLVESEMTSSAGHFLDYLFETSNYFKDKKDIYWFLNNKFKFNKIIPPKYCNIKKIIQSNTFNRKKNKFYYIMEEVFFFFKNYFDILFFIFFFVKDKKKLFSFFKCLCGNTFFIPRYFKSFYLEYLKLNLNSDDDMVFQSCRRKDIALVYFLYNIEKKTIPRIHLRIFFIPKVRYKDFYFYFKKIKDAIQNKIFLYTENGVKKNILTKELGSDYFINTTKPIFSFYKRKPNIKFHTIGFVGEARSNKGFNRIPEFIKAIQKNENNFKFLIHFSNLDSDTVKTAKVLRDLSLKYNNIEIINEYCDYNEYRKILEKITIMPFLYDLDQIKIGSGILYSCLSYEIIPIIPKNCDYLEEVMTEKSIIEAESFDDFIKITKNIKTDYMKYLSFIKDSSIKLNQSIKADLLVKNINRA